MSIKSYLVFPHKGKKQELESALGYLPWCDVIPAENKELLVVVAETKDEKDEEEFLDYVNKIDSLDHLSLVSGFDND